MRKIILTAALALAATPALSGQSGFNPGTVVSNVYESPACAGVCGFGYSPPAYRHAGFVPHRRHPHAKADPAS